MITRVLRLCLPALLLLGLFLPAWSAATPSANECTTTAPGEAVVTAGMYAFHTAGLVLFAAVAASAMTMTES